MTVRVFYLLLLILVCGLQQGCFPVIAAGVGSGVLMVQDRRSRDAFIEDQQIEVQALQRIEDQFKREMHVNVTSYNHRVLISGEVLEDSTRSEISKIVSGLQNVRDVYNELAISSISSLPSRSNDGLITSNVKLRFVNDPRFNADHIKVVTEDSTVYLLGLVNHAEADAATDVTSTTQGVQRVVRMFEYLD